MACCGQPLDPTVWLRSFVPAMPLPATPRKQEWMKQVTMTKSQKPLNSEVRASSAMDLICIDIQLSTLYNESFSSKFWRALANETFKKSPTASALQGGGRD